MNYEITKPPVNYPMGLTGSLPKHFNPNMFASYGI